MVKMAAKITGFTLAYILLFCRHENRTMNRAWQVKLHIDIIAG
jgi:hypothetical protein